MKGRYTTLVKRELWEHRWLWMAPVIAAGLLICLTVVGAVAWSTRGMPDASPRLRFEISGMHNGLFNFSMQLFLVAAIGAVIYLLDCLYSERKDRSILFWKSLPVSDLQTVLTKFSVGLVLLPLGAFVLATLVFPVTYAIGAIAWPGYTGLAGAWSVGDWLRAELWLFGRLAVTILWYAPVGAWLMLTSVVSSRSPYVLTGLPLLVLGVGETMLLQTRHVWQFVGSRILPVDSFTEGLQRPGLWIGLAVAAGMLYMVVRLRRYRDDT